ncbi:hypothetical protein GCM10009789_66880 [Kribbella sancticallisti]|uniref:DUF222 domain-containing protein n=1 Tax=Kribbella sancticallisti TaxID=460087 RepID=A0ABP4Q7S1_9ACTN
MTLTQELMQKIGTAVELGQNGERQAAREQLEVLWRDAGENAFARCTVAHYLADVQETTENELEWDLRALQAADELTDDQVDGLKVEALSPSLHLNLADDYRRLSRAAEAQQHLDLARGRLGVLADDAYGDLIRGAVDRVEVALEAGSVEPLPTNPSSRG